MTDDAERQPVPVVTFVLLAACWVMALATLPGGHDTLMLRLYRFGAKDNGSLASGAYWRLLTAAFLHGGVIHLLVNSWSLWALGTMLEPVVGRLRFLATFLVCAATGSLASWAFNASLGVGASGALFGLLGTALYLSWRGQTERIPPTALRSFGIWTVINLAYGFTTPGIDNAAHLGGLAGGIVCAVLLSGTVWPAICIAAGLAVLAWGGYDIAKTPDTTGQAAAFIRAESADEKGDTATAKQALAEAPDFAPALISNAFFRLREGDNQAALAAADSALQLLADTGVRGRTSRRTASAIGIESRVLTGRAHLFRAWALFGLDQVDEGIVEASIAKSSPEAYAHTRASLLLGQAYMQQGKAEEALGSYRDAAGANTRELRAEAQYGIAFALDRLGRGPEALVAITAAIRLDSTDSRYASLKQELERRIPAGALPKP